MDEQERNSLKIVVSFIIPFGIISNIFELILFELGLTNQISGLAVALSAFVEQDWAEFLSGVAFTLFTGFFFIAFLDWGLTKLIGFKLFRSDAWKRAAILGVILGLITPLLGVISDSSAVNTILILIALVLTWIIFRYYSATLGGSRK